MKKEKFLKKVLSFAHEKKLWQRGDRILAAVSGGPDSLGLLLFLNEIREKEHIEIGCCCVNHHLRDAAEEETEGVRTICGELSIPFFRKDVQVLEAEEKGSVETVARDLRYKALSEVMEKGKYNLLATAHHEDDQAETILFHLLRGSGLNGLAGIRPKRGNKIRPFLPVTKEEIGKFVSLFPYVPFHDETNDIPDATRNKIRLQLMPELLAYNPNLKAALSRLSETAAGDEDLLRKEAEKESSHFSEAGEGLFYPRNYFRTLHPAIQRRILISAIGKTSGKTPDFEGVERFRQLALREGIHRTSESGTVLETKGKILYFHKGNTRKQPEGKGSDYFRYFYQNLSEKTKHIANKTGIIRYTSLTTDLGTFHLTGELLKEPVPTGKNQYLLDADQAGALSLRRAEKTNCFAPFGMEGTKTVFSILQEHGIPAALRKEWPVLADDKYIYWTCFLRGSRRARPGGDTKNFLLLTVEWEDKENNHGEPGERY